jgi:acetolactate synthase-1/3 small subunit
MGQNNYSNSGHHIYSVLVENKFGVLTRIAALFARRGFNIYSLAVSPTEDDNFSRMTIVVNADSTPLEQVVKQLHKLIPVIKISEIGNGQGVERELMLVTIQADANNRGMVTELAAIFEASIVDVGHDTLTLMMTGTPDQVDAFGDLVRPHGVVAVQRTGRIALPKLAREAPTKLRSVKSA